MPRQLPKEKARPFVKEYYENAYQDEVKVFAKEHLDAELYGSPFRWEDYEAFKSRIDEAYKEYLNETETVCREIPRRSGGSPHRR